MKAATAGGFRGWQVPYEIDEVLVPNEVYAAHDRDGTRYVIARTARATWLGAPISERALACVASGEAELRAVFSHSLTGMVEQLTEAGESFVPCAELTDDLLPRPGVRLTWQQRCA
jgi:hypothetical protein